MIEMSLYWISELALWIAGVIFSYENPRREGYTKRRMLCLLVYIGFVGTVNLFLQEMVSVEMVGSFFLGFRLLGLGILIVSHLFCWKGSWTIAVYESICAFMSWQLLYEVWLGMISLGLDFYIRPILAVVVIIVIYVVGYVAVALTIARWMKVEGTKKVGPRQLSSAILIFGIFEVVALNPHTMELDIGKWQSSYLAQMLLALLLYLQNELFKKSAMRQELEVMNLLWKKEQEQYRLSKENIALINQKCHDLKHQIHAIRSADKEEMDKYLEEMEGSIRIYEAIVKTGNEVLDTILTEKSLYCKEKGITVSCVADGSQMDFIHTVDLYAILGNALDNAIEAVEKFKHEEKRQIDVLIYRQQHFLVMNIVNPMKESLIYEEELPVTTKGDKRYHGFGLRSMKYLIKKYDGYLNISEADGCFSLKILIPMPTAEADHETKEVHKEIST
ncbi:MAG: sensor histidine kinase [Lachnospiraceae bacterium]|nr:sensor histidine kinase [Lachnospiraceae bacterium]